MKSILPALPELSADGRMLFAARSLRMFAYGFLAVGLAIYLAQIGLSDERIGLLFSLTLAGDMFVSLFLATRADRYGRRRTLVIGAALMMSAGIVFAVTRDFFWLLLAATIGVLSPSGNEVGPFLAIEQAALSQVVPDRRRTGVFAWYALAGSLMTALGSLAGGMIAQLLKTTAMQPQTSGRITILGYAICGGLLILLFPRLSVGVEAPADAHAAKRSPGRLGLDHSFGIVAKLSGLFALDAFAGGFVIQSFAAYWFHVRYGADPAVLGGIFFGANLLAGFSALAASSLAARFGLINTMVFTHLPSNILLLMVPLMPNLPLAILVLLLRFSISQMDVPTRQSYTMAVVPAGERAAAAGVTAAARAIGASIAPFCAGLLFARPELFNFPFYLGGGLKIIYDVLLYRAFIAMKPDEEQLHREKE